MNRAIVILLFVSLLFSSSCERDDLCTPDQSTSPRMVVVFKDATAPSLIKVAPQLRVKVLGSSEFAPLDFEGNTFKEAADTIYLPLRNFDDETIYSFQRENEINLNSDIITFDYNPEEEYVSRACGFKIDYLELDADLNIETPNNPWISSINVIDATINDSNEVHVEIYH